MIGTRAQPMFSAPVVVGTPPIAPTPEQAAGMYGDASRPGQASAASNAASQQGGGLWDRIKSEIQKPGMAGAFLRAAAPLFNGDGLGAAIQAGAGYVDHTKANEAHAQQQQFANSMDVLKQRVDQQQADQTGAHYERGDVNQLMGINETGRHNRASEGIDANGQRIQLYGIDTGAATTRRGQDVSLVTNQQDNAQSDRNSQRGYDASIYGNNLDYAAKTGPAGIASKNAGYVETTTKLPGKPAANGWFSDTAAVPATETTTRMPMAAPAAAAPPPAAVNALKANPNLRAQFEAKFGAGTASQYLGGR